MSTILNKIRYLYFTVSVELNRLFVHRETRGMCNKQFFNRNYFLIVMKVRPIFRQGWSLPKRVSTLRPFLQNIRLGKVEVPESDKRFYSMDTITTVKSFIVNALD